MKPTGIILMILGALAAIAGLAAPVVGTNVAVGAVNSTDSTTYVDGVLPQLLNTDKLVANPSDPYDTDVPIKQTRVTQSNAEAMDQQDAKDAEASVFTTTATTTREDTGAELSVSEAQYAFNPQNSELINCCGANIGGNEDVDFSGVMPLKFPFGTAEADVQLWNDTVQAPVTATFVEKVNEYDMDLYKFQVSIPVTQTPAPPLEVPAPLAKGLAASLAPQLADQIPADGNVGLYEFYTAESEYLVEPLTGQIVSGYTSDKTTFRLDGGTEDIVTKVSTEAGSADVEAGAADIKSSADQLTLVATATPVGLGAGALAFLGGLGLTIAGSKKKKEASTATRPAAATSAPPKAPAPGAAAVAATKATDDATPRVEAAADDVKAAGDDVADKAKSAGDDVKSAADDVADDVKSAADDVADKAKTAADDLADKAKAAGDDLKSAADEVADKAKDQFGGGNTPTN